MFNPLCTEKPVWQQVRSAVDLPATSAILWAGYPILIEPGLRTSVMANTLQDKTILVVGPGSGIARAVALRARSEGARVIVAGRDRQTPCVVDQPGGSFVLFSGVHAFKL